MKKTLSIILIFLSVPAMSRVTFKRCNNYQVKELSYLSTIAVNQAQNLFQFFNKEISLQKERKVRQKLKSAKKITRCALKKLRKIRYDCNDPKYTDSKYMANTLPIIGREVNILKPFWKQGDLTQAAILVHEATHKCGTTDATYFYHEAPHNVGVVSWPWIASSYDTLILRGHCIPHLTCN